MRVVHDVAGFHHTESLELAIAGFPYEETATILAAWARAPLAGTLRPRRNGEHLQRRWW